MTNAEVAALFLETAALLELAQGNPFRVRAYQRAAAAVAGCPRPVCEMGEKELLEIPGVGAGIAAQTREAAGRGTSADLRTVRGRVPAGLLELLRVPGLGPKRALFLFDHVKVKDL